MGYYKAYRMYIMFKSRCYRPEKYASTRYSSNIACSFAMFLSMIPCNCKQYPQHGTETNFGSEKLTLMSKNHVVANL